MWKRPAYQTLLKALGISSATAQIAPDLPKALAILSDTVRKSVNWDNQTGIQKKGHISLSNHQAN